MDALNKGSPVSSNSPSELLEPYVTACESAKKAGQPLPKPVNFIVITDGASDDPASLAYSLAGFADRLDAARLPLSQLGVQMVQIGNDPEATQALQELDDDLKVKFKSRSVFVASQLISIYTDTTQHQKRHCRYRPFQRCHRWRLSVESLLGWNKPLCRWSALKKFAVCTRRFSDEYVLVSCLYHTGGMFMLWSTIVHDDPYRLCRVTEPTYCPQSVNSLAKAH